MRLESDVMLLADLRSLDAFAYSSFRLTHTYVHTYIRTHIHTYVHTYIRTYIHTALISELHLDWQSPKFVTTDLFSSPEYYCYWSPAIALHWFPPVFTFWFESLAFAFGFGLEMERLGRRHTVTVVLAFFFFFNFKIFLPLSMYIINGWFGYYLHMQVGMSLEVYLLTCTATINRPTCLGIPQEEVGSQILDNYYFGYIIRAAPQTLTIQFFSIWQCTC